MEDPLDRAIMQHKIYKVRQLNRAIELLDFKEAYFVVYGDYPNSIALKRLIKSEPFKDFASEKVESSAIDYFWSIDV